MLSRHQKGAGKLMDEEQDQSQSQEEQVDAEYTEQQQEARTVPLEALEAERRKRQELEIHNRALQDMVARSSSNQASKHEEEDEDDDEFITKAELKRRLKETHTGSRRELLEEAYCQANPVAVSEIEKHLESIIKRKPWLAQTIESAPNRYARAYEIVQDYTTKEVAPAKKFSDPKADAKRIVENSQKPGSPTSIAKAAQGSNADYLRSIAGTKEFSEYRKKMRSGR